MNRILWELIPVALGVMASPAAGRYDLDQYCPLEPDADGGLTTAIGSVPVDEVAESSRLPSAPERPFSPTFRSYAPRDVFPFGPWSPPALRRISWTTSFADVGGLGWLTWRGRHAASHAGPRFDERIPA